MKASILIISKNRKVDLDFTLQVLEKTIDYLNQEILVFLDGCTDDSISLKGKYEQVRWFEGVKSIGASAARQFLYPKAKGNFLIGLDDDAHPLTSDFINKTICIFEEKPTLGIIAYQEIKGVFGSDEKAIDSVDSIKEEFLCNEFVGCGFAIRKEVYNLTGGFPVWIDIYGEEACLAIEVIAKGYDIMYSNEIKINHRVNIQERKKSKHNYFRFGKQLKNATFYYIVYYQNPLYKIFRLYEHNFRKYALMDLKYCAIFLSVIVQVLLHFPRVIKHRKPIDKKIILKMNRLRTAKF